MKQPDMYIFQYEDGTVKYFEKILFYDLNPTCYIGIHGKIICKFKIYRK